MSFLVIGLYILEANAQQGFIIHRPSGKLIHPFGGSSSPSDNTKLVIYRGGLGLPRVQLEFEEALDEDGYGYIKHSLSGKYVCPMGRSNQPNENTPLVFLSGARRSCLFIFDVVNDYIIHKGSKKIWHPEDSSGNPSDNTVVVLKSARHNRATFFMGDNQRKKIDFFFSGPIVEIVHRLSQKEVRVLGTNLVVSSRGGDAFQIEKDTSKSGFVYLRHVKSGKYVCPSVAGGSSYNTPLIVQSVKQLTCLFKFDKSKNYFIHMSSKQIWHPFGGRSNPDENTQVVLHHHQHERAEFIIVSIHIPKI